MSPSLKSLNLRLLSDSTTHTQHDSTDFLTHSSEHNKYNPTTLHTSSSTPSSINSSHSIDKKPTKKVDLDLYSHLVNNPAPKSQLSLLELLNKIITIYNTITSNPASQKLQIETFEKRKRSLNTIEKDLKKLSQISSLIVEYRRKNGSNLKNLLDTSPSSSSPNAPKLNTTLSEERLIKTAKKYPNLSKKDMQQLAHTLSNFTQIDSQVLNILYHCCQREINIMDTSFLIPLVKSITMFLQTLTYHYSPKTDSQNPPNPLNSSYITSVANKSIDLILFSLEQIVHKFQLEKNKDEKQNRLLVSLVLNIQMLVLSYGSPLMRHRLHDCCAKLALRGESLAKVYSNQVLLYLGTGIANTNIPNKSIDSLYPAVSYTVSSQLTEELESALHVWMEATAANVELTSTCNEIMIHKLLDAGEVDIATQILSAMTEFENRQLVFSRTWGHYLAAASEQRNMRALEFAWDQAISTGKVAPSDAVYFNIIETCLQHLSSDQVTQKRQEAKISKMLLESTQALSYRSNHANDPYLVTNVVEELSAQGNLRNAFRVLVLFGSSGLRIKLIDLPLLISAVGKSKENIEHGIQVCFRALSHPNTTKEAVTLLFNLVGMGILKSKDLAHVSMINLLLRHVPGASKGINFPTISGVPKYSKPLAPTGDFISVNADTVRILCEAAVLARNPDLVESYYHTLVPLQVPFSRFVVAFVVQALLRLGQDGRALKFLDTELEKHLGRGWEQQGSEVYLYKVFKDNVVEQAEKVRLRNLSMIV